MFLVFDGIDWCLLKEEEIIEKLTMGAGEKAPEKIS
jgi:hypothetical protein